MLTTAVLKRLAMSLFCVAASLAPRCSSRKGSLCQAGFDLSLAIL